MAPTARPGRRVRFLPARGIVTARSSGCGTNSHARTPSMLLHDTNHAHHPCHPGHVFVRFISFDGGCQASVIHPGLRMSSPSTSELFSGGSNKVA